MLILNDRVGLLDALSLEDLILCVFNDGLAALTPIIIDELELTDRELHQKHSFFFLNIVADLQNGVVQDKVPVGVYLTVT